MDIAQILSQVKSPFTDEEIEKLIKKYIECNCKMDEFYRRINLIAEEKENPYLHDLYSRLFSLSNRGERFVEGNSSWTIIGSNNEILNVPIEHEDRVPIYRIYINAKGKDKAKIVEDYIRRCEDAGQVYKLKYSTMDGRQDEIVILSYGEDLANNIELVENITEGMSLGEPAELSGRYKDKIGIGEEYIQAPIYSYTKSRLGIIPIVMQKYFLDHMVQFKKYLAEQNNGFGQPILKHFERKSQKILKQIDTLPEDRKQYKKKLENQQFAYQNNIFPEIGDMNNSLCQFIPETIQTYMAEHSEIAIPEITESYRMACEIFGISREGVFSKATQDFMEQQKLTALQQREAELSALEAEARKYDELENLKGKLEQKEGQDIGEN